MFGMLVIVFLAAAAIKMFVALCGHQITWRLAVVLVALVVLVATASPPP